MNWGTKIVLGMIAFMLFIVAMVVYMFKQHDNDGLIEEDYYEKSINYDQQINAQQNVITSHAQPKFVIAKDTLTIALKDNAQYDLKLLRPSATKDDVQQKGMTQGVDHEIVVNTSKMAKGLWLLQLKWVANGKIYVFNQNITL